MSPKLQGSLAHGSPPANVTTKSPRSRRDGPKLAGGTGKKVAHGRGYATGVISEHFDQARWETGPGFEFVDITYHRAVDQGTVRVAINRPEVRNAFRPTTVDELYLALNHARQTTDIGVVLLTGNGPSPKDGGWAFCSGGDQRIRGADGYQYEGEKAQFDRPQGRLHILEVQRLIRFMSKIVIAVVPGWAVGGGHSLHVVCDLTLACAEHALFKQTDPDVASFDGGLARLISPAWSARSGLARSSSGSGISGRRSHCDGDGQRRDPHDDLEGLHWMGRRDRAKSPTAQMM